MHNVRYGSWYITRSSVDWVNDRCDRQGRIKCWGIKRRAGYTREHRKQNKNFFTFSTWSSTELSTRLNHIYSFFSFILFSTTLLIFVFCRLLRACVVPMATRYVTNVLSHQSYSMKAPFISQGFTTIVQSNEKLSR